MDRNGDIRTASSIQSRYRLHYSVYRTRPPVLHCKRNSRQEDGCCVSQHHRKHEYTRSMGNTGRDSGSHRGIRCPSISVHPETIYHWHCYSPRIRSQQHTVERINHVELAHPQQVHFEVVLDATTNKPSQTPPKLTGTTTGHPTVL